MLRIPYCLDNQLTHGNEFGNFMHRMCSTQQKHFLFFVPCTRFCSRLNKPLGLVEPGGLRILIKFIHQRWSYQESAGVHLLCAHKRSFDPENLIKTKINEKLKTFHYFPHLNKLIFQLTMKCNMTSLIFKPICILDKYVQMQPDSLRNCVPWREHIKNTNK
jgi:hypothetical protein